VQEVDWYIFKEIAHAKENANMWFCVRRLVFFDNIENMPLSHFCISSITVFRYFLKNNNFWIQKSVLWNRGISKFKRIGWVLSSGWAREAEAVFTHFASSPSTRGDRRSELGGCSEPTLSIFTCCTSSIFYGGKISLAFHWPQEVYMWDYKMSSRLEKQQKADAAHDLQIRAAIIVE